LITGEQVIMCLHTTYFGLWTLLLYGYHYYCWTPWYARLL